MTAQTQLYTDAETGQLVERTFQLRIVAGADGDVAQATRVLDKGTTMVGTHADNDVVLTDPTVSRYHLELRVRRDGIELRDLGTTNGTKHAGVRIGQIVVTEATRVRLGKNTELAIEPVDAMVDVAGFREPKFGNVLGSSPEMLRIFGLLSRIAPTDSTVMLLGETGTGKEQLADAIHRASHRAAGPYIVVDCGAIPESLIASELFGYVKGAFTGASADKQGLIAAAHDGTLFLDEIGELPLELQPQLLRVLDRRQVRRVGETHATDVNIRVIAATHRDLRAQVKAGKFREDLYYRLAVVAAPVPPLRARKGDIPGLVQHFATLLGRGDVRFSEALLAELMRHDWPGNVRELRNVVERGLSLGDFAVDAEFGPATSSGRLPGILGDEGGAPGAATATGNVLDRPFKEAKSALIEAFEREYLVALLARHHGNISRAAAEAGIDRNYIHRLVKKYELDVDRG